MTAPRPNHSTTSCSASTSTASARPPGRRAYRRLAQQLEWLARDAELGVDLAVVHNVCGDQERFIEAFGEHVLPRLRSSGA